MNIKVHNTTIVDNFQQGNVVFKIQSIPMNKTSGDDKPKDIYMVTEYDDVIQKLNHHQYTPLLYLVPFITKLAYLYGCLNYSYNQKKNEKYVFYWRTIGTQIWSKWFTVLPYNDTIF